MTDPRRSLPQLGSLLEHPVISEAMTSHGHDRVVQALRAALDDGRDRAVQGSPITTDELVAMAVERLHADAAPGLTPVINATGVLLHTNLGRAPLSAAAIEAMTAAAGAVDLEIDLDTGDRGGRDAPLRDRLARLTGAPAAIVVNNGAAALVLALSTLADDGGVVVSRGELIEIGGSFRIPDIVRSAGVELVEVGTTNRTHVRDYRHAVEAGASAILRVHPSNFRMEGFVHRPTTAELVEVAAEGDVPFIDDLGSGALRPHPATPGEPVASESIAAGASVVLFSGDKLLGGPQAGIIAGDERLIERCRRAPLFRALRLDKLRIAALAATLDAYERGAAPSLPVWAMAEVTTDALRDRAVTVASACDGEVVSVDAVLGGGSTPGAVLPSVGVALELEGAPDGLAQALRTGTPAVVPRIVDGRVVIDLRSVAPDDDVRLIQALRSVHPPAPGTA
ncbi:MAG: L-seryl-tRNA(Sec) selenium transferase [Nitriliruptoraceae bacterium]